MYTFIIKFNIAVISIFYLNAETDVALTCESIRNYPKPKYYMIQDLTIVDSIFNFTQTVINKKDNFYTGKFAANSRISIRLISGDNKIMSICFGKYDYLPIYVDDILYNPEKDFHKFIIKKLLLINAITEWDIK